MEYEIKNVYPGLDAVFVNGACIGVVIPSRVFDSSYKRIFFTYEEAKCFYGIDSHSAVASYFASRTALEHG